MEGGDDEIQLMGYHAVVDGGDGNDQLIAASFSKFSLLMVIQVMILSY